MVEEQGITLPYILNNFSPLREMLDSRITLVPEEDPGQLPGNSIGFSFEINNRHYEAFFSELPISRFVDLDAIDHEERGKDYFFGFFGENKEGNTTDALTGTGNAPMVFSAIYQAIREFVKKIPDFDTLYFGSRWYEPTRVKMYDRMAPRLARALGLQYETYDNEQAGRIYILINPNN